MTERALTAIVVGAFASPPKRTMRLLLLAALLLDVGCKRAPAETPTTSQGPATALAAQQKLALASVVGVGPVDVGIAQLQALLGKKPTDDAAWAALGRAWISKARVSGDPGYYLNAEACAQVILARSPDATPALELRALVLVNQHRFAEARTLAEKIVARAPENVVAYAALSDALLELGDVDASTAAVQKMVDLKPNLPSYARAAHLRWLHGDLPGARDLYKSAIGSGGDPRDPEPQAWVIVQAATVFFQGGDDEGALAGAELASKRVVDYPPALVLQGRIALARGDAKAAIAPLEKAFAASPTIETAWLLGDARTATGDEKGAALAFAHVENKGRVLDPRTLSLFWSVKKKNAKEALALAEEEKKTRGDPYTDDALAWALHRNGRDADAKVAILRATRFGTKDARLLFHAGAIQIALGEIVEGKKRVAEALALRPGFDLSEAVEAKALL